MTRDESDNTGTSEIALIQVFRGETEIERKAFAIKEKIAIGRDPYADISLEDPTVSRLHAEICREGGRYVLYDRSSNGLLVNGRAITRHVLNSGDVVSVGRFGVIIELHADSRTSLYDEAHAEGWDLDDERTIEVARGDAARPKTRL